MSYSLLECDSLAKIHGNWCGPNWTGGQNVAAEDYKGDWNGPVTTPLDAACRAHDLDTAQHGPNKKGDTKLIKAAEGRILPFLDSVKLDVEYTKLVLQGKSGSKRAKDIQKRLNESSDAGMIATGISIIRPFRRA